MSNQINIALKELENITITETDNNGAVFLSPEFEQKLLTLKRIEALLEVAKARASELLRQEFDKRAGMSVFEGDLIRASRVRKKTKVIKGDPHKLYQDDFSRKFLKLVPDAEPLNVYKKAMGKLPEGFEEESASEYIDYREIKKHGQAKN